jgi:hypothetical protein
MSNVLLEIAGKSKSLNQHSWRRCAGSGLCPRTGPDSSGSLRSAYQCSARWGLVPGMHNAEQASAALRDEQLLCEHRTCSFCSRLVDRQVSNMRNMHLRCGTRLVQVYTVVPASHHNLRQGRQARASQSNHVHFARRRGLQES